MVHSHPRNVPHPHPTYPRGDGCLSLHNTLQCNMQMQKKKYTRSSVNCCGTRSKSLRPSRLLFLHAIYACPLSVGGRAPKHQRKKFLVLPPSLSLCLKVTRPKFPLSDSELRHRQTATRQIEGGKGTQRKKNVASPPGSTRFVLFFFSFFRSHTSPIKTKRVKMKVCWESTQKA